MSNITSIADYQNSFGLMLSGVAANAADLTGTEAVQAGLADAVTEIVEAQDRQKLFKALAQQATRDLEDALARGKVLYSRLRSGVVMHYTATSEKLVEFGLQPRRPAVRSKVKPPTPEDGKPGSAPGPNPIATATPETDGKTEEVKAG